jgi:TusA-related sulfurtransferase
MSRKPSIFIAALAFALVTGAATWTIGADTPAPAPSTSSESSAPERGHHGMMHGPHMGRMGGPMMGGGTCGMMGPGMMGPGMCGGMMGGCPMMGPKVDVKVEKTKNGATISLTSDDPKVVRRIQAHAEIMRLMHELGSDDGGGTPAE